MSTRSFNKLLTGLKVKKRSWIPKIKRRKENNDDSRKNELTLSITEPGEISSIENEENQEQLYSIIPISIFNLPTEIYLQIFSYLLFADLYTLSCVSKFFRDLLWSKSDFTQSIWKNCRTLHYPKYPTLPPPDGMCEQQYIWITLAKKTCQFCKETYENSGYVKWIVKTNCCDLCMAEDKYTMEENSVNKSIMFPRELKGCIPYTEYIGYFGSNDLDEDKFNYHRHYFIQDVEKIKNEYDSLEEEEKKDWIENKRRELENYLEKIKDYQKQDSDYYWSKFKVPKPEIIEIDDDDDEDEDDEYDEDDDDDDQVYDQVVYNQIDYSQIDYDQDYDLDNVYVDYDFDYDDDEILF